jgi:lipopolysaccharide transport system ATP-binding protein
VGLVGRNGAGKSTLLKILSRITTPSHGRVELYGRVGSLLEVGTGFHHELSGRENIFLNGSILGMKRADVRKQFDAIVDFAGVGPFLDTPVKRYSSGMYVRLAFAVAAHLQPDILIVDEVLAVGDAPFQQKCLGKMREVSQGGRTVLFVSHNLGTVQSLCRSAVWLQAGKVEQSGDARSVTEAYLRSTTGTAGTTTNLDAIRDRPGSGGVRLLQVEVNHGQTVRHGEPFTLRLHYRIERTSEDVSFGYGISDPGGVRILSVDTDHTDARRTLEAGATGTVTLTVPQLLIHPGTYLLDLDCRSGPSHSLEYLPAVTTVEVLPGPNTPAFIARGRGGIQLPAQVDWPASSHSASER